MNISLAEAIPLKSSLSRRIQELVRERQQVSTVTIQPDGTKEEHKRTIEEVAAELETTRSHYRELDIAIAKANVTSTFKWQEKDITILEAIELAKQIRGEVNELKRFGSQKKKETQRSWGTEQPTVVETTYDPDEYRKEALVLEKRVQKLSALIDKTNHVTEIPFSAADSYIEL